MHTGASEQQCQGRASSQRGSQVPHWKACPDSNSVAMEKLGLETNDFASQANGGEKDNLHEAMVKQVMESRAQWGASAPG